MSHLAQLADHKGWQAVTPHQYALSSLLTFQKCDPTGYFRQHHLQKTDVDDSHPPRLPKVKCGTRPTERKVHAIPRFCNDPFVSPRVNAL